MNQRPTHDTLVCVTIFEPEDTVALLDRAATILRRPQQLSRYDDHEFLDLERAKENMAKQKAKQATIRFATRGDPSGNFAEEGSFKPSRHETHNFSDKPPLLRQAGCHGTE